MQSWQRLAFYLIAENKLERRYGVVVVHVGEQKLIGCPDNDLLNFPSCVNSIGESYKLQLKFFGTVISISLDNGIGKDDTFQCGMPVIYSVFEYFSYFHFISFYIIFAIFVKELRIVDLQVPTRG